MKNCKFYLAQIHLSKDGCVKRGDKEITYFNNEPRVKNVDGEWEPYTFTQEDVLAEDWELLLNLHREIQLSALYNFAIELKMQISKENPDCGFDEFEDEAARKRLGLGIKYQGKTLIMDWDKLDYLPQIVRTNIKYIKNPNNNKDIVCIEDITERAFMKTRNLGKKGWEAFVKLRGY